MKKSIKTIGTMMAVGVMLVGTFGLGSVTSNQTVDAQMKTEPKEIMPQEEACPERRIMCGNYYDYMVIETVDGNEWLLDDSEGSQYIEDGAAVFEEGELVQVVFDTMGTECITDDVIVDVRSIDWRDKQCRDKYWTT